MICLYPNETDTHQSTSTLYARCAAADDDMVRRVSASYLPAAKQMAKVPKTSESTYLLTVL